MGLVGDFLEKWWYPTNPWGFPTKNDQHLGCEMGVPPFKETPICLQNEPPDPCRLLHNETTFCWICLVSHVSFNTDGMMMKLFPSVKVKIMIFHRANFVLNQPGFFMEWNHCFSSLTCWRETCCHESRCGGYPDYSKFRMICDPGRSPQYHQTNDQLVGSST